MAGFNLAQTLGIGGDVGGAMNNLQNLSPAIALSNGKVPGLPGVFGMSLTGQNGGAGGYDASGKPVQPGYTSQLESPTYQSMKSQYDSASASPWANIAISRQGKLAEQQKQELAQRNAGQTAGAMDKLATVGGLSSGARERTVQSGQQAYMTGVQDVGNQYGQNVMNIGIDDAQAKLGIGKGLLTAEMGDLSGRNNYNQGKYTADMAAWAASQQANATRDAGKKSGGFLSSLF